jgi:hypothetical protein
MSATELERAHAWVVGEDTGISSKAIWAKMMGTRRRDSCHPWDPDDLGRCLRLLEAVPEWKPRLSEMADVSPIWAALVARWDEIAQSMADEVGIDWSKSQSASRTYNMMRTIIDGASLQEGEPRAD